LISSLLLYFAGIIRRRKLLPRRVFIAFFVAILPMTLALIMQLFIDIFPFIDFSYVLSALTMYSLILSDQIDQGRLHQLEIIKPGLFSDLERYGFPCHGDNTRPEDWYGNPIGRFGVIKNLKDTAIIRSRKRLAESEGGEFVRSKT
jgi:hypothetical protein